MLLHCSTVFLSEAVFTTACADLLALANRIEPIPKPPKQRKRGVVATPAAPVPVIASAEAIGSRRMSVWLGWTVDPVNAEQQVRSHQDECVSL